jgi:hypothetical protein
MSLKNSLRSHDRRIASEGSPFEAPTSEELRLFEDILISGAELRVKVTGRSMAPFLNDGDVVRIRKVDRGMLAPGDLIFFKTAQGAPVLHRIMTRRRTRENRMRYVTKGDALIACDAPVMDDDILGKVIKIEKSLRTGKSRSIDLESGLWKRINYGIALVQRLLLRFRRCLTTNPTRSA